MGKQGPCCHCGVTSTPLWRNGPSEKPVLCNACGSRWRTKGTLVNYVPLHTRVLTSPDFEDSKNYRENKLQSSTKSKSWLYNESKVEDGHSFAAYHPYSTCFEDDTSNRSSSGSAVSVSESCVQYGSTEGNEISGPFHSNFSDIRIPSKKRTRTRRQSPSPIEKFRQDLVNILQQQDSSYLSEFSGEALLIEGEDLSFDSEIGHGSVLLKPPVSSKDEESEASSHVIGNKVFCLKETYMRSSSYSVQSQNTEISSHDIGKDLMIKDTWETNELKKNPARQCASTNSSLEGTLSGDPDVLQSKYSAQINANVKPSINGSSNSAKEVSSLTSDVTGSGISIISKRPRDSPYFYTFEGKCFGTTSTFKSPRIQSHVEMLTSGEKSVNIQAPLSEGKSISARSQSLNSEVNNSMSTVQVELP